MEVEEITLLERDKINFEEGREEEKIQMAKKLLVREMSIEEVASITELTREQVGSLVE